MHSIYLYSVHHNDNNLCCCFCWWWIVFHFIFAIRNKNWIVNRFLFVTLYKVPITFPFFRWCAYIFVCVCGYALSNCWFIGEKMVERKWIEIEKNIIIMLFTVVTKSLNDAIAINQTISFYSLWKWTDHRLSLRWPVRVVWSSKSSRTCVSSASLEECGMSYFKKKY
jgi:hypothetical protein